MSIWLIFVLACSFLYLSCMGLRFLDFGDCFLSHVREIFYYILFKYLLKTPIFFSFSVPSIIQMFVYLMLSQQSLRLSWFVSIIFLYSSPQWSFPPLHLPVHSSILLPYVFCHWFLVSVIFISAIILFIYVCLFV